MHALKLPTRETDVAITSCELATLQLLHWAFHAYKYHLISG